MVGAIRSSAWHAIMLFALLQAAVGGRALGDTDVPSVGAVEAWAAQQLEMARAHLDDTNDAAAARFVVDRAFDVLVAYHPLTDRRGRVDPGFVALASLRTHLHHMAALPASLSASVGPMVRERETLMSALNALVDPEHDNVDGVYRVVLRIVRARGDKVEAFAELVAALAVVHDEGAVFARVEQRVAEPATPLAIFDHLTRRARQLQFDPRTLPGELLVHVVDVAASAADLAWAHERAAQDRMVGQRYHEVAYDDAALRYGNERLGLNTGDHRSEPTGFSLATIKRFGGVCRHQAFYAEHLAKAIGVPAVWVRADGPDLGHAWVGYLRRAGSRIEWDMSEGRWSDYEKVRGEIRCPQSGRTLSDEQVSMLADLMGVPLSNRLAAVMLLEAAGRLGSVSAWPPVLPDSLVRHDEDTPARRRGLRARGLPRTATAEVRFELMASALRRAPALGRGWRAVLAESDSMDIAARSFWFDAFSAVAGRQYPDVLFTTVRPMIRSMPDARARDRGWAWAARRVRGRPQLELEVSVERARDLERAGEHDAAWRMFTEAATRYAQEGPFVMTALSEASRMVAAVDRDDAMLDVYARVWRQLSPPSASIGASYTRRSTFVRVGHAYASALEAAGQTRDAERVRRRLPEPN